MCATSTSVQSDWPVFSRRSPAPDFGTVATLFEPFFGKDDVRDCTHSGAYGLEDLVMRFRNGRVVRALGPVSDRDVVVVPLTGELNDGTPIRGEDVIVIIEHHGRARPADEAGLSPDLADDTANMSDLEGVE